LTIRPDLGCILDVAIVRFPTCLRLSFDKERRYCDPPGPTLNRDERFRRPGDDLHGFIDRHQAKRTLPHGRITLLQGDGLRFGARVKLRERPSGLDVFRLAVDGNLMRAAHQGLAAGTQRAHYGFRSQVIGGEERVRGIREVERYRGDSSTNPFV